MSSLTLRVSVKCAILTRERYLASDRNFNALPPTKRDRRPRELPRGGRKLLRRGSSGDATIHHTSDVAVIPPALTKSL